ncbi:MAG: hypothetical protein JWL73_1418 [Actinomycetia bacterium]|nr:hypothetical protein [Actinomycetes bacterium]
MPDAPEFVSFVSDYGLVDGFVGICKAVMLQFAPDLSIIDVTHDVAPYDVRGGALALVRAVPYLPAGIVLAIVDPGVGTDRRAIAVEVENGYLIGPDNGLLAPAVAMMGGARRVISLTNPDFQLAPVGPTFAGRDVMAPAAGHLADGVALEDLGELVDPVTLTPGLIALPQIEAGGAMTAEVWWIDRFGNCQLNVDPVQLTAQGAEPGGPIEVHLGGRTRTARWVSTYAEAKPSELVVLVDSTGLISLAMDRSSTAETFGLHVGSGVALLPPGTSVDGAGSEPG